MRIFLADILHDQKSLEVLGNQTYSPNSSKFTIFKFKFLENYSFRMMTSRIVLLY